MNPYCKTPGLVVVLFAVFTNAFGFQSGNPIPDSLKVVAPGATLQQVSTQFTFTEGPAVDKKGTIYFTDQPNDKIWSYDTDGKLSL
ncbi:MAG TPA: SMP-30/gluconolactonase/LRE family protein, partial [Fibrella sp.]